MPNNEDWIEEFDKEFPETKDKKRVGRPPLGRVKVSNINLYTPKQIKSFILKLKSRWVEEERERIMEMIDGEMNKEAKYGDTEIYDTLEFIKLLISTTPNKDI